MESLPENARKWTPQLRDAIGKGVEEILGFSGKAEEAKPETSGKKSASVARRKPPVQVKPGTRPANGGGQGLSEMEREVRDTFGF